MASEKIDEITTRYSMLQSLSVSDVEDSLEGKIYHTQGMQVQIAAEMSKLQEEPSQQAKLVDPVTNLQDLQTQNQQLAEIMEEEMTHQDEVSVLLHMCLQQVEEVKAQSQEIHHLLALVEQQ